MSERQIFYRMRHAIDEQGINVITNELVSIHESECWHWCVDKNRIGADNLAAVADCIEALRTLERHDASLMRAAFTGFAQLASPEAMGRSHWRTVLNTDSNDIEAVRKAYRSAIRDAHPDRGGSSEAFHRVQEAWSQAQVELS